MRGNAFRFLGQHVRWKPSRGVERSVIRSHDFIQMLVPIPHATPAEYPQEGQQGPVLSFNQPLGSRVTRCRGDFCDLGCPHELVGHLCSQSEALSHCMHVGVPCLANHFFNSILDVVTASYSSWLQGTASANLDGEVINYHRNARVVAV